MLPDLHEIASKALSAEIIVGDIPPFTAGVYILLDDGRPEYIGQTADLRARLRAHHRRFPGREVRFLREQSEARRLALEAILILLLRPAANRAILLALRPHVVGPEWVSAAHWGRKLLRKRP